MPLPSTDTFPSSVSEGVCTQRHPRASISVETLHSQRLGLIYSKGKVRLLSRLIHRTSCAPRGPTTRNTLTRRRPGREAAHPAGSIADTRRNLSGKKLAASSPETEHGSRALWRKLKDLLQMTQPSLHCQEHYLTRCIPWRFAFLPVLPHKKSRENSQSSQCNRDPAYLRVSPWSPPAAPAAATLTILLFLKCATLVPASVPSPSNALPRA